MKQAVIISVYLGILAWPAYGQNDARVLTSGSGYNVESPTVTHYRSDDPGTHEFSFWGGYSFQSNDGIWGNTPGAQLGLFGMRYNRKFLSFPNHQLLEYTLELNMIANYHYPAFTLQAERASLSGFGVAPVGLQFNWRQDQPLQPFIKSAAGVLYLDNPFPDSRGTKLNFTLEFGGGLEMVMNEHLSFTLGYKYHHMSNGETGSVNPGIDSNLFYGAFTIF